MLLRNNWENQKYIRLKKKPLQQSVTNHHQLFNQFSQSHYFCLYWILVLIHDVCRVIMEGQVNQAYDGDHKGQQTFEVEDPRVQKPKKWEVMKNVVCISIAFMVLFTSYQSMASLQSSINQASFFNTKYENSLKSLILGWWIGHILLINHLCRTDRFVTIYAKFGDQICRCEMDHGWMHALLYPLHWCSILSNLLYSFTSSGDFGHCCSTFMDR